MLLTADRDSLLKSLDRVSKIVKSNPRAIELLQCVLLETYGDDLYIIAKSHNVAARVCVPNTIVKSAGSSIVAFDRLREAVKNSSANIVMDTSSDTSMKIYSSDDQRIGIPTKDVREFPSTIWLDLDESYAVDTTDFIVALQESVSLSNSNSSLSPMFMQVLIKDNCITSANGVSYQRIPIKCHKSLEVSIPINSVPLIVGFIKESGIDKAWVSTDTGKQIVLSTGKDQFQVSALAVTFPDLDSVFSSAAVRTAESLEVDRKKFIAELTKARLYSDEYGRVSLRIIGPAITSVSISSKDNNGGWFESAVNAVWSNKNPVDLIFSVDSLLNFLKLFQKDTVTLKLGDDFRGDKTPMYCIEGGTIGVLNQFNI